MEISQEHFRRWGAGAVSTAIGMLVALSPAIAAFAPGDDLDAVPIRYSTTPATDPVARLQERIDRGEVSLAYEPGRGYLVSVLQQLKIPVSSQMLVFSKTSFQRDLISPTSPRAIYYNDDAYLGWVRGGRVLEISAVDPRLGGTFYTLEQTPAAKPRFVRQTYECLSCHSSTLTKGIPGHVLRSVYSGRDGLPILAAGTHITTSASPLEDRYGGWYVTGTHGSQGHMGNVMVGSAAEAERLDRTAGANVADLREFFDPSPYLTRHSDIVALAVLAHQVEVHNLITRANYETRRALHY